MADRPTSAPLYEPNIGPWNARCGATFALCGNRIRHPGGRSHEDRSRGNKRTGRYVEAILKRWRWRENLA